MKSCRKDDLIAGFHICNQVLPCLPGLHKKLAGSGDVRRRHGAGLCASSNGLRARRWHEWWRHNR
jgi:hypothetical protein